VTPNAQVKAAAPPKAGTSGLEPIVGPAARLIFETPLSVELAPQPPLFLLYPGASIATPLLFVFLRQAAASHSAPVTGLSVLRASMATRLLCRLAVRLLSASVFEAFQRYYRLLILSRT